MNIRDMKMRLLKLQDNDKEGKKLRSKKLPEGQKDIEEVFYYQNILYVSNVICSKLISRHYNNPLVDNFDIEKSWELIARKYYQLVLRQDVEVYIKGCNVCLALKAVCHKPYKDLELLPILTYWQKNLSIEFVTNLPISANRKDDSYNLILVLVD